MLELGLLRDGDGRYSLPGSAQPLPIPTALHDLLAARLYAVLGKAVAQLGAVIGREFSYQLMAAASSLGISQLDQALSELVELGGWLQCEAGRRKRPTRSSMRLFRTPLTKGC